MYSRNSIHFIRKCCGKATSHSPTIKTIEKGVPRRVLKWLDEVCTLLYPKSLYICKGNIEDREMLIEECLCCGMLRQLMAHKNCFLARSDHDDAYVKEDNLFYSGFNKKDFIPRTCGDIPSILGNFLELPKADELISCNFKNAMKGRKMYCVPFLLGPRNSHIQILGMEVTDSPLAALLALIMHRAGYDVLNALRDHEEMCFYKAVHAMAKPEMTKEGTTWPCDPENAFLVQIPERREVWSYGSNFGHNALLIHKAMGKSVAAFKGYKDCDQFMAEQMAVIGIQKVGEPDSKVYLGIMGPEGCGKSTMASLLTTRMPQYRVTLVSDSLAWLKPDKDTNMIHAMNPEQGVFSYVQGVSWSTTPIPMTASTTNTIYINTASTDCDCVFWDTIEAFDDIPVRDWKDHRWTKQKLAAHIGARYSTRLTQFVNLDRKWECANGVPLSGILVGTRRCNGYPLIFETNWTTAVTLLASLRTELYDNSDNPYLVPGDIKVHPFGTKPFLGYNLGRYASQWFLLGQTNCLIPPRFFFYNLFRRDQGGKLLWPGYQENVRLLDWVFNRVRGGGVSCDNAIGCFPASGSFCMEGLCDPNVTYEELFSHDKAFWKAEIDQIDYFFRQQLPLDTPCPVCHEMERLKEAYSC